jgi:exodeoxyribonuclease-3
MVLISYNINGIRAAAKKDLFQWMLATKADLIGLQEVKAERSQIDLTTLQDAGYQIYWNSANRKGYSGVAVVTKNQALQVETEIGDEELDGEGAF